MQTQESGWLPAGLFELGQRLANRIDTQLGATVVGAASRWVDMPRRLSDPKQDAPLAAVPASPVAWGDEFLCVDLGPDDAATWQRFAEFAADENDFEKVASQAQEWRLAVTPYRQLAASRPSASEQAYEPPVPAPDISRTKIVDLTSMWAGPLCTQLLALAGAQVTKITCSQRPDGLAGSPLYAALNAAKTTAEVDLNSVSERHEFDKLLSESDLLVTSLSPRALRNFELVPARLAETFPRLRMLAITAFSPDTVEADWIAYGTGVHAAAGLGWLEAGLEANSDMSKTAPLVPTYSYPDPLAGLLGCSVALELLASTMADLPSTATSRCQHRHVSLFEAIQPLIDVSAAAP